MTNKSEHSLLLKSITIALYTVKHMLDGGAGFSPSLRKVEGGGIGAPINSIIHIFIQKGPQRLG